MSSGHIVGNMPTNLSGKQNRPIAVEGIRVNSDRAILLPFELRCFLKFSRITLAVSILRVVSNTDLPDEILSICKTYICKNVGFSAPKRSIEATTNERYNFNVLLVLGVIALLS